jgi:hypothetical protein
MKGIIHAAGTVDMFESFNQVSLFLIFYSRNVFYEFIPNFTLGSSVFGQNSTF